MSVPNLKVIYLYDEGIDNFNFAPIKDFLATSFGKIPIHLVKLKKKVVQTRGLLFDFLATQKAFAALGFAKVKNTCQIILTPRLFATLEEDIRPHIRASIYGYPSIISTAGIVEGPAKPKEYYFYKQKYLQLGIWEKEEDGLKKKFKGRFIDYQDKRMNEVIKGYLSQAIFFYLTGEPFCQRKDCRLYNAHWQEDLIYSQIKSARFCKKHQKVLRQL